MELKETVTMMQSEDYKDRFRAEYWQTKIRYEKLHKMVVKADAGTLDFEPKCNIGLLRDQKRLMGEYLYILELRAEIEGITLSLDFEKLKKSFSELASVFGDKNAK